MKLKYTFNIYVPIVIINIIMVCIFKYTFVPMLHGYKVANLKFELKHVARIILIRWVHCKEI